MADVNFNISTLGAKIVIFEDKLYLQFADDNREKIGVVVSDKPLVVKIQFEKEVDSGNPPPDYPPIW